MGFKKGTAQAIVDNEINRINKQLLSSAKTFGAGSRQLEITAFAVAQKVGYNNIVFKDGVPQIRRSNQLINSIINNDKMNKDFANLKGLKTVQQLKKEHRQSVKAQYPNYNKLSQKEKDKLMRDMTDFARNNIAETMAKYVADSAENITDTDDFDDMMETNYKSGRETNALINSDYMERFTPVADEYRKDESFKGMFNPVIDKETGEVLSADSAYSMIKDIYRKEGLL